MKRLLISLTVSVMLVCGIITSLHFVYQKITNAEILAVFPEARGSYTEGILEEIMIDEDSYNEYYKNSFSRVYNMTNGNMVFVKEATITGFTGTQKIVLGAKENKWVSIAILNLELETQEETELYNNLINAYIDAPVIHLLNMQYPQDDNLDEIYLAFYQILLPKGVAEDAKMSAVNTELLRALNSTYTYYHCYSGVKDSELKKYERIAVSDLYSGTGIKAVYKHGDNLIIRGYAQGSHSLVIKTDNNSDQYYDLNETSLNIRADVMVTINTKTNKIVKINYFFFKNQNSNRSYGNEIKDSFKQMEGKSTLEKFVFHDTINEDVDFPGANLDAIAGSTASANVLARAVNNATSYYNNYVWQTLSTQGAE